MQTDNQRECNIEREEGHKKERQRGRAKIDRGVERAGEREREREREIERGIERD